MAAVSVLSFNHPRDYLEAVYQDRALKNPSYSLRAYARDLKLTSSFLVDLLKGKRRLGTDGGRRVAERLKLKGLELTFFQTLTERELAETDAEREPLSARLHSLHMQSGWKNQRDHWAAMDANQMKSWLHYVLIRFYNRPRAPYAAQYLSEYLGVSPAQIRKAHEDLVAGKMLIAHPDGRLEIDGPIRFGPNGVHPDGWKDILEDLARIGEHSRKQGAPGHTRHFIVPVTPAQRDALFERITQFIGELHAQFTDPAPENPEAYLLLINAAPLAQAGKVVAR